MLIFLHQDPPWIPSILPTDSDKICEMTKTKDKTTEKRPSFESSIKSLELIVNKLEDEEASLDEALAQFEKGILLVREAQHTLSESEQRVKLLLNGGEGPVSRTLPAEESQD